MLVFADYETYYDSSDYTLKKMTPAEYILDPRFKAHGMAFQTGEGGEPQWCLGSNLPTFFKYMRAQRALGHKITMVTFNALFDMCITAWRYNFVPDVMIDVLGMARAHYGPALTRFSLGHLAEYLELPQGLKGDFVGKVNGLRTDEIKALGLMDGLAAYAKQDVNLMYGIYRRIMPAYPAREIIINDLVLRACVEPQFKYDLPLLEQHLDDVKNAKADLLAQAGLAYDADGKCPELMSTNKFKALLEARGVRVEEKVSLAGRIVPALAKTDTFMQNLLEDPDEVVAALAAARLGHKSTLEETRTQRFISIANLPGAPGYTAGSAPIPLRYGAAHTHRLGGEWKLNKQNLPRKSKLRNALTVDDDKEVISADEAQIEARMSAWFAGEKTLLREFTDKLDPYGQLGAAVFGLPAPVKGDTDWRKVKYPVEGFIGKTGILGLGYGAGADKFHTMVNSMARISLPADKLATFNFSEDMAQKAVNTYRNRYYRMPRIWRVLQVDGMAALTGAEVSCVVNPVVIKRGMIWGPNGQRLLYPDLQQDNTGEWTYVNGRVRSKIYGAKLLENIIQWLARIVVMEAGLRLYILHNMKFALQAHDELVYVVKKDNVVGAKQLIKQEMERRPTWGPDIPLEVEVKSGPNYGAAK